MNKPGSPGGYLIKVIIIAGLGFIITWLLKDAGKLKLDLVFLILPPALFAILSVVSHTILLRSVKGRPQRFVSVFMGILGLKMFLHLLVMLAIAFLYPSSAVQFIIVYAVFYLVFTVFEVVSLMPVARTNASAERS